MEAAAPEQEAEAEAEDTKPESEANVDTELDAELAPSLESEPEVVTELESKPEAVQGLEPATEPGAEPGAEPASEKVSEPRAEGESESDAQPESEQDAEAAEAESAPEAGAESAPEAEAESAPEAEAESAPEAEAEPAPEAEAESAPEAEAESAPEAEAESGQDTEQKSEPAAEPNSKQDAGESEPTAEPESKTDAEATSAAESVPGSVLACDPLELEPESEPIEPDSEPELLESGHQPRTDERQNSPSADATAALAASTMADENTNKGRIEPEMSMVFTEESGELGAAGTEAELKQIEAGSRPTTSHSTSHSTRSRLDTPQRTEVIDGIIEPVLDGLWPYERPDELVLCIIVRPIAIRHELVCSSTTSWYGVKEMLSEALGISPLDMTIVCHGEPRADDVTLLEDEIQTETRLEMLIATPHPTAVAKESSAQLRRRLYSGPNSSGGRLTYQLRNQQWEHPPRPPVKPAPPPYRQLAIAPQFFQPTPPMAETIELIKEVDTFTASRFAQQHDMDAAWNTVNAVADSDGIAAGPEALELHHVSPAVGDPGCNPYTTLPWDEAVLPRSSADELRTFGLQHDPYGWGTTRKKQFSRSSKRGGMRKGNLPSDIAQETTPEENEMVEEAQPPGWTQAWPLNEANRLLVAKLLVRADSYAHQGSRDVVREAACRNGALVIGRCNERVTSAEQAALELKLQNHVGQWLGELIDEELSICKDIEAEVSKSRRDALLDARRQTVSLPKVQVGIRAHHADDDSTGSGDVMSDVFAKRGRVIKMPRMRPPAYSLYKSSSARGAVKNPRQKTPRLSRLTSETRALIDEQEHQSAADAWRQSARESSSHVSRTPRLFPQYSYRTSKALAEGRAVEDGDYVKMRLSARRHHELKQMELIESRFDEPDGTVQVWLEAKNAEVPYKVKKVAQARKDMRQIDAERLVRKTRREKDAKGLLRQINFLLERAAQNQQNAKFSQKAVEEQRMKEMRIAEFEGRLKRGQISLHLMGALKTVHRTLVMDLFNEMDADGGGTLDREEVRNLARSLGNQLTDAQLDQAMAEMDEDGSAEVDFEEFFDWWCKALNQKDDGSGQKGAIKINAKGAESEGYEVVPFGK